MTPTHHANPIPNILTGLRLAAGVVMFLMLAGAAPGFMDGFLSPEQQLSFGVWAFWIFAVAAGTPRPAGAPSLIRSPTRC